MALTGIMNKLKQILLLLPLSALLAFSTALQAQNQFVQNFSEQMEIPGIIEIASSPAHLYVLSEDEGLVVFRAHTDSLQWLYTSTGMQRRGNKIKADARFAYLYGNNRRLTVIEPTSVLGVYSSTVLPDRPLAVDRLGNFLYIAFGEKGLGKISLDTPETVDTTPEFIDEGRFEGDGVTDLASDNLDQLYVLSGGRYIDIYSGDPESGSISHSERVRLNGTANRLFLVNGELLASNRNGDLFMVDSDGQLRRFGQLGSPVRKAGFWNEFLVTGTENNQIWIGRMGDSMNRWKEYERAGNHFTVVENQFWVSEFNSFAPVIHRIQPEVASNEQAEPGTFRIKPVENISLPFPRPLLIPIEMEAPGYSPGDISLSYEGTIDNARIRGNTFYWQPRASQTGRQQFSITASTSDGNSASTEFSVDLRPFNAPPRFTPTRPISIPVETKFELEIEAFDPDGRNPNLVRYLGVDLPDGADLNERTGHFIWTPNIRQVGEFSFRVIATDQYGAAASQEYTIRVVEMDDEEDEDNIYQEID